MEALRQLDYCPEFAHDLLGVIHKGLLHPDKRQRWDCTKVAAELDKIRRKCDSSKTYCITPFKWDGRPLENFTVSVRDNLSLMTFSEGNMAEPLTTSTPTIKLRTISTASWPVPKSKLGTIALEA